MNNHVQVDKENYKNILPDGDYRTAAQGPGERVAGAPKMRERIEHSQIIVRLSRVSENFKALSSNSNRHI